MIVVVVLLVKFNSSIQMKQISISWNKTRKNGLKTLKNSNPFIEYSNNMQSVSKNIEEYDC